MQPRVEMRSDVCKICDAEHLAFYDCAMSDLKVKILQLLKENQQLKESLVERHHSTSNAQSPALTQKLPSLIHRDEKYNAGSGTRGQDGSTKGRIPSS